MGTGYRKSRKTEEKEGKDNREYSTVHHYCQAPARCMVGPASLKIRPLEKKVTVQTTASREIPKYGSLLQNFKIQLADENLLKRCPK